MFLARKKEWSNEKKGVKQENLHITTEKKEYIREKKGVWMIKELLYKRKYGVKGVFNEENRVII